MILNMTHRWPSFLLLTAVCAIVPVRSGGLKAAEISKAEHGAYLALLSSSIKENYESIDTWRGSLSFADTTHYYGAAATHVYRQTSGSETGSTDALTKQRAGRVSFAVDAKKNQLYSKIRCDKPMQYQASGQPTFSKEQESLWHEQCIVTSESYMHLSPLLHYGQSNTLVSDDAKGRMAFKEPREEAQGRSLGNVIDPRDTFNYGIPVWEELDTISRHLPNSGTIEIDGREMKIEKDGNRITVSIPGKVGANTYLYKNMVFDADKGYNIVSLEMVDGQDGTVRQRRTWEYEAAKGTWVPNRMVHQVFDPKAGGLKFERTYAFEGNTLNEPIPDETFTYKNLGLEDGDRFLDTIEGVEYTYNGGKLVAASNKALINELVTNALDSMANGQPEGSSGPNQPLQVDPCSVFLPDETIALTKNQPYILALSAANLLYLPKGVDSEDTYRGLLDKGVGGVAYKDGYLIALGQNAWLYVEGCELKRQMTLEFKQWYSRWRLSEVDQFPVHVFVQTNDGSLYELRLQEKASNGLRLAFQKADPSAMQAHPTMMDYFDLNTRQDINLKDTAASRLLRAGPEAVPALVQSLASGRKRTAMLAAEALGKLGDARPEVVDALARSFQSDGIFEAGLVLGRLGDKAHKAVPTLIAVIGESSSCCDEKQRIAIQSLGKIGPNAKESVPILKKLVSTSNPRTKITVIGALAKIGYQTAENTAILQDMLKNDQFKNNARHIELELRQLKGIQAK